ncbi:MAG TPA: S8/S53 family peptidase [Actinomycetota bacterium]|nr:S8/S53 family peptidase [Actinomycetota bacterium]
MPARVLAVALSVLCVAATQPASADNRFGGRDVIVAVLDTGLNPLHQEFDYRGPSSDDDQIVAWWDFTEAKGAKRNPAPGRLWDDRAPDPFDDNGHGTATASLAAGRNAAPFAVKEPSFAPGTQLAIGKVGNKGGSISGDAAAAVRWAVDTVKADVINMSFGHSYPFPSVWDDTDEALAYARRAGVTVVVANGNGFGNAGGPGAPGWASPNSTSDVISVGASDVFGVITHTDPEVVAKFFGVKAAGHNCNACYAGATGTSFSAPLVAGMAAKLIDTALAAGRPSTPQAVETLLKWSARDTLYPPSMEGYGVLDAASFAPAVQHAAAGTLPSSPNPVNALYVEQVANGLREHWSTTLDGGARHRIHPAGIAADTPEGVIGTSLPAGLAEAERHEFALAPGSTVTIDVGYGPGDPTLKDVQDIDFYVYSGNAESFTAEDLVVKSANEAGEAEKMSFTTTEGGTYTLVVVGWMIVADQPYTLSSSVAMQPSLDAMYVVVSDQGLVG